MNQEVKLPDVVALLQTIPEAKLRIGQVGTVVEIFSNYVPHFVFLQKTHIFAN